MSIAEYQLSLKNLIDATTDETILKRWKSQWEADLKQGSEKSSDDHQESSLSEPVSDTKDDTLGYVVIESGLGIDE